MTILLQGIVGSTAYGLNNADSAEAAFDAARSPLPDEPDREAVERWLRRVRAAHWTA